MDSTAPEDAGPEKDPGYASVREFLLYGLSLPERALRSATGVVGGALRESASLLVPQAFQNSKTYTVMVRQMLDFVTEDIGGVERKSSGAPQVENYVARKAVANFIDLAGLATFHLSPMLLLAAFSDVAYGSKAYLQELATELKREGVIDENSTIDRVDDLLAALGDTARTAATAFDVPPLSLDGVKKTIDDTREAVATIDPASVLPQAEIARLWDEMKTTAVREGVNPLAVSSAMTLYSLEKIGQFGRGALSTVRAVSTLVDRHVIDHYRRALGSIGERGIYRTVAETSQPYIEAVWSNFSSSKVTVTEDVVSGRLLGRAWKAVGRWLGRSDERPAL